MSLLHQRLKNTSSRNVVRSPIATLAIGESSRGTRLFLLWLAESAETKRQQKLSVYIMAHCGKHLKRHRRAWRGFVGLADSKNIPTVHSQVKLNSDHSNWNIHPPVTSTFPERILHCQILTARTTSWNSHIPLQPRTVVAGTFHKWWVFLFCSRPPALYAFWRSYTNILSCQNLSCVDRLRGLFSTDP